MYRMNLNFQTSPFKRRQTSLVHLSKYNQFSLFKSLSSSPYILLLPIHLLLKLENMLPYQPSTLYLSLKILHRNNVTLPFAGRQGWHQMSLDLANLECLLPCSCCDGCCFEEQSHKFTACLRISVRDLLEVGRIASIPTWAVMGMDTCDRAVSLEQSTLRGVEVDASNLSSLFCSGLGTLWSF